MEGLRVNHKESGFALRYVKPVGITREQYVDESGHSDKGVERRLASSSKKVFRPAASSRLNW